MTPEPTRPQGTELPDDALEGVTGGSISAGNVQAPSTLWQPGPFGPTFVPPSPGSRTT